MKGKKKANEVADDCCYDDDDDDDGDDPTKLTKRWKKKSILFESPYWEVNCTYFHCLDNIYIYFH